MNKNIKPIVFQLAQKLMSKGLELDNSTDWNTFMDYTSCGTVCVAYYKDDDHWFRMEQNLKHSDAEQNLRNFIHNIERLQREYESKQNIKAIVSRLNKDYEDLHSTGINIYDDENPEWRLKEVEYYPSADEIFFKCQYTDRGVDK